ncbi:hypothetical protein HYN59_14090 [Flavobacterium album]|uniref:Uncharacterized protein n=1 Tax=Flavobacterium album TaxID=2175091 RepID=A0A2S1R0I2_9FLAO|nr:hypothetical protein [Flavobacterium album]AWH86168.1 hypothetical protein HYN59_14090 [Flavobacterium album]
MNDILQIPLRVRKAKLIVFVFAIAAITLILWFTLPSLLANDFTWKTALGGVIFIVGLGFAIKSLFDGLTMKKPELIVAVKDGIAVFFIRHAKGIANQSEEITLSEYSRFYTVKSRSRIMITDISFEFVPKSGFLRKKVDPFPELFGIDNYSVSRVLQFIGDAEPGINIGYDGGIISQVFRK